jgi:hypothetical protein
MEAAIKTGRGLFSILVATFALAGHPIKSE